MILPGKGRGTTRRVVEGALVQVQRFRRVPSVSRLRDCHLPLAGRT
jgi:hypothetical protein